jgi:hypothetical protein
LGHLPGDVVGGPAQPHVFFLTGAARRLACFGQRWRRRLSTSCWPGSPLTFHFHYALLNRLRRIGRSCWEPLALGGRLVAAVSFRRRASTTWLVHCLRKCLSLPRRLCWSCCCSYGRASAATRRSAGHLGTPAFVPMLLPAARHAGSATHVPHKLTSPDTAQSLA